MPNQPDGAGDAQLADEHHHPHEHLEPHEHEQPDEHEHHRILQMREEGDQFGLVGLGNLQVNLQGGGLGSFS